MTARVNALLERLLRRDDLAQDEAAALLRGLTDEALPAAVAGAEALDTEGTIWLVRPVTGQRAATYGKARKVEAFVECMRLGLLTGL